MRLLGFTVLSAVLMVVDARFEVLKPVRSQLGLLLTPVYWLTDLPLRVWEGVSEQFASHSELLAENQKLKAEALLLQRRLQKLATLTEQNVRLRELLNSSALVDDEVIIGELIGLDPNPFTQRIIIDKGERDGVFVGQPVLDASGLMGQVVEVMPYAARVLLITDVTHSIPVQVNRSRYLLLVFNDARSPEERANAAAEAQLRADRAAAERAGVTFERPDDTPMNSEELQP